MTIIFLKSGDKKILSGKTSEATASFKKEEIMKKEKFYRYMSVNEFNKMLAGRKIVGHKFPTTRTTSAGICFLSENTSFVSDDGSVHNMTPVECLDFLEGVVTNDVLVEFSTDVLPKESSGAYADPFGYDGLICIKEYCVPEYDRNTFHPVRYAMVQDPQRAVWYNIH